MYKKPISDLLFVLLPFSAVSAQPVDIKRPNILICITDDQSWVFTSFAGEKAITTPAFDKVARDGIYFRNAFCASPSCSPSRGSILTGQEMWRLGEGAQLYSAVPKKIEKLSFPLLLRDDGYSIGYTQKGWEPNDFKVHGWKEYPLGKGYNERKLQPPAKGMVNNDYDANFADFLDECPEEKPFFSGSAVLNHIVLLKQIPVPNMVLIRTKLKSRGFCRMFRKSGTILQIICLK